MGVRMDQEFLVSDISVEALLTLAHLHRDGVMWVSDGRIMAQMAISKFFEPTSEIKLEMLRNTLQRQVTLNYVLEDDRGRYHLRDGVVEHNLVSRDCDVCNLLKQTRPAVADAQTQTGRWGYVCAEHFVTEGCSLGEGRGQLLAGRDA